MSNIPLEEETRNNGSTSERNRNQIQFWERSLVKLMSRLLDGSDVFGIRDVEVCGVRRERTGSQCSDQLCGSLDGVQAWVETVGDGGKSEDGQVIHGAMLDVRMEEIVEHGHADNLADGADDN